MADEVEDPAEGSGDESYQTLRGFLTGEDPEEPIYFAFQATLRIFGTIPNLDEVSENLGLVPTHVHRRDELRRSSSRPYEHDMWQYEAPVKESEPLHTHIDALWAAVRDRKEYLLDLKRTATVDVFCGYRSNSDTAGVDVRYESRRFFMSRSAVQLVDNHRLTRRANPNPSCSSVPERVFFPITGRYTSALYRK